MNTVMVLDDDSNVRVVIERLLAPEGFTVSHASSLREFDEKKGSEQIDLLTCPPEVPSL